MAFFFLNVPANLLLIRNYGNYAMKTKVMTTPNIIEGTVKHYPTKKR